MVSFDCDLHSCAAAYHHPWVEDTFQFDNKFEHKTLNANVRIGIRTSFLECGSVHVYGFAIMELDYATFHVSCVRHCQM